MQAMMSEYPGDTSHIANAFYTEYGLDMDIQVEIFSDNITDRNIAYLKNILCWYTTSSFNIVGKTMQ